MTETGKLKKLSAISLFSETKNKVGVKIVEHEFGIHSLFRHPAK